MLPIKYPRGADFETDGRMGGLGQMSPSAEKMASWPATNSTAVLGAPKDFTAERTRLTAAAKRRGDDAVAKRISSARQTDDGGVDRQPAGAAAQDTRQRLADLGDRLHAAHAAMDGARIRDLSAEQHKLIDELTRAALQAADVSGRRRAVRDDITSTLQAAIADPEVRQRLGRLARPERWSGFGAFGDAAPISTSAPGSE